jgi:hypothetical protein
MPMRRLVLVMGLAACGILAPKPKMYVLSDDGVPVIIVNRTSRNIHSMEFSGATHIDYYGHGLAPNGGRIQIHVIPSALKENHILGVHAAGDGGIVYHENADTIAIEGPTEIDISDTDFITDPVPPGFRRVIKLSDQVRKPREQAEADRMAEHDKAQQDRTIADARVKAAADCKPNVDAIHRRPHPGKTKIHGRYQCVTSAGLKSRVDLVELVDGKITATVEELASGRWVQTTWTGIVEGDTIRFAYATSAASAGFLKVDPGGRAMIGEITDLDATGVSCAAATITCTR